MGAPSPRDRRPADSPSDEDLVAAAAAGDRQRFTELYRRHLSAVFGRLTRIVGPVPERDDLVQQIFLDVHHALPRFRGEARFTTFLHRIVINVAYAHLAKQRRQRARAPLPPAPHGPDPLDDLIAPSPSPEARAQQRQELARAFHHLEAIKPKKRIAFVLVAVEGLSLEDAAELVGATPDSVKQRVLHARRELAARIARATRREEGHGQGHEPDPQQDHEQGHEDDR